MDETHAYDNDRDDDDGGNDARHHDGATTAHSLRWAIARTEF